MLACSFASSCGGSKEILEEQVTNINKKQTQSNISFFFRDMNKLDIKVYYQDSAEPYHGDNVGSVFKTWGLTENNLKKIFEEREQEITLTIPKELNEMTEISNPKQDNWSSSQILEVARANNHLDKNEETKEGTFSIIFLDGYFVGDDAIENRGVIAVSLNGTNVIAVFKPVIETMANGNERLGSFVEQSTIVHEMGHALGLVNNGVGLTSPHQDEEHGAHCTNTDCVMYWQNEGRSNLVTFVQNFMNNGNVVLFGDECLQDFKSF